METKNKEGHKKSIRLDLLAIICGIVTGIALILIGNVIDSSNTINGIFLRSEEPYKTLLLFFIGGSTGYNIGIALHYGKRVFWFLFGTFVVFLIVTFFSNFGNLTKMGLLITGFLAPLLFILSKLIEEPSKIRNIFKGMFYFLSNSTLISFSAIEFVLPILKIEIKIFMYPLAFILTFIALIILEKVGSATFRDNNINSKQFV